MSENSKIQWTDHTFNPWIGCQKVSPGCDFCYAETWDNRFGGIRWGPHAQRTRTAPANWNKPYVWDRKAKAEGRRYRVFCASLADVFDNKVPREWRSSLWRVIAQTPNLDWQLLTKRPENIAAMLPPDWGNGWPGVWLGVSVEDQQRADRRIPLLLDTPAAIRFVSYEPALGPVDFSRYHIGWSECDTCGKPRDPTEEYPLGTALMCNECDGMVEIAGHHLHWIIVGGESGPHARPFHLECAYSVIEQCRAAQMPVFFKQWGSNPYWKGVQIPVLTGEPIRDPKGGDPDEWPADLRVREMPTPKGESK